VIAAATKTLFLFIYFAPTRTRHAPVVSCALGHDDVSILFSSCLPRTCARASVCVRVCVCVCVCVCVENKKTESNVSSFSALIYVYEPMYKAHIYSFFFIIFFFFFEEEWESHYKKCFCKFLSKKVND